jgi:hypothetical protein
MAGFTDPEAGAAAACSVLPGLHPAAQIGNSWLHLELIISILPSASSLLAA